MTENEVQLIKRIQYLEYKLEIVYQSVKQMKEAASEINLDEFEES
jgi:hypothetical protein